MRYSSDMNGLALSFVHKRLIRAAGGFVTGGFGGAAAGFLRGEEAAPIVRQPSRKTVTRTATARPSVAGAQEQEVGRSAKFAPSGGGGGGRCFPPTRRDPRTGECRIFLGTQTGRDDDPIPATRLPTRDPSLGVGQAVMGRYGAGLQPGNKVIDRAVCLRGMKLGNDGICYDRIRNSDRMWPKGRRPLLTGGEMRAISIASSAGRRLTKAAVRLHEIGLIKKPITRKPPKKTKH